MREASFCRFPQYSIFGTFQRGELDWGKGRPPPDLGGAALTKSDERLRHDHQLEHRLRTLSG
jgi:hypothetical protein